MNRKEFKRLKIGDTVTITIQGTNKGKQGTVEKIKRNSEWGGGTIYLRPLNCEFEFPNKSSERLHNISGDGLYNWNYTNISFLKNTNESINKDFYVDGKNGQNGVSWSTDNFTLSELNTIQRFLDELQTHAIELNINDICIVDNEGV